MKKELITVDNLDTYICKQDGKLYVFGPRLLTAGAKDELSRRRVSIEYGPEPVATAPACGKANGHCHGGCKVCDTIALEPAFTGSLENLARTVVTALRDKYGVSDPEQLKQLTVKALKVLKGQI